MGAAASSGSDTTPADDLAASFESWVTSGGERCAAAIAALEAASPALAAALRSADADAVRGALTAPAATEDGVATSLASSTATHLEGVGATLAPCDEAGVEPAEVHEEAGDAVADSAAAHVANAWCRRAARIARAGKHARATLSSGCSTGANIQR